MIRWRAGDSLVITEIMFLTVEHHLYLRGGACISSCVEPGYLPSLSRVCARGVHGHVWGKAADWPPSMFSLIVVTVRLWFLLWCLHPVVGRPLPNQAPGDASSFKTAVTEHSPACPSPQPALCSELLKDCRANGALEHLAGEKLGSQCWSVLILGKKWRTE